MPSLVGTLLTKQCWNWRGKRDATTRSALTSSDLLPPTLPALFSQTMAVMLFALTVLKKSTVPRTRWSDTNDPLLLT